MHYRHCRIVCSGDDELNSANGSICIVGKDEKFTLYEGEDLQPFSDRLEVTNNDDGDEGEAAPEGGGYAMEASRDLLFSTTSNY